MSIFAFTRCTLDDRYVTIPSYCVPELLHLPTFADLLTAHIDRVGISDADLARRIGVSRLTLIRWKEGVTSRPRYREDVLRCAELLRLTPEERDELLVSADFQPEGGPPAPEPTPEPQGAALAVAGNAPGPPVTVTTAATPAVVITGTPKRRRLRIAGAIAVAAAALAVVAVVLALRFTGGPDYPVAVAGESLIAIAPFANYTAGQQGFNVQGRLRTSIDREIATARLSGVRTVDWPEEIADEPDAMKAVERSGASIIIWGEYDSGRVLASLTIPRGQSEARGPQVVDIASSPTELPTAVNIDLTAEVRSVALLTLGQLYLERREFDLAKTVLIQALADPPSDPAALAGLRYRLGRAYLGGQYADFDEAIWLFTQVLAVQPRSGDSYNGRGLAYLERGRPGDADRAIADLSRAADLGAPAASHHYNLAVAYLERGQEGDLARALNDLERAIEADPDSAEALVNRAAAYLQRGDPGDLDLAFEDLEKAIELQPELATAWTNRGNAYLLRGEEGDWDLAEADFTTAIDLDPYSATGYYNRGLMFSVMGGVTTSVFDFQRAHQREPRSFLYNNTLCWQMGIDQEPEQALPYCDLAVELFPGGPAHDSRGLVYAVMGRNDEAIEDFRAFLAWVDTSVKETCRPHYRPSRESWIATLQSGGNPFNYATLQELRLRPAAPAAAAPC